jgi:hypothetical protein
MLCPECGRSDGFCDCLLTGPFRKEGTANPGTSPQAGVTGDGQASAAIDWGPLDGLDGPGFFEVPAGTEWAGNLLQFLRDFSSAAPAASPAASPEQMGRNRPVGRTSGDLDLGSHGGLATAETAAEPLGGYSDNTDGPFSAADGAPPAPAGSPIVGKVPLRVAPFVHSQPTDEAMVTVEPLDAPVPWPR